MRGQIAQRPFPFWAGHRRGEDFLDGGGEEREAPDARRGVPALLQLGGQRSRTDRDPVQPNRPTDRDPRDAEEAHGGVRWLDIRAEDTGRAVDAVLRVCRELKKTCTVQP